MASDVVALTVPLTNATATTRGVDATDSAPFDLPYDDCATDGNVTRGHSKPGKKDDHSSRQPAPALVASLLGAAMVSNDAERAAAVDASDAAATDDTLRGGMADLTPPG